MFYKTKNQMKKLILLLFMLIPFIGNANIVKETLDSATAATQGVLNTVDTSAVSKQLYTDVKAGIVGLADGLKVSAENVWNILVKQQLVESITWLIVNLLFLIAIIIVWICWNKSKDQEEWWGIPVILTILQLTVLAFSINGIVTGFVNPEYGAIEDIISFIKNK